MNLTAKDYLKAPRTSHAASHPLPTRLLPFAILLALLAFYLAASFRYRPYDVDNPWFLSFSYNTCVEHIDTDSFMNTPFPAGMDGTQLFGKIAAYTQCDLLSRAAWQQYPGAVVSSSFVVLALGLWWLLLRRLHYTPRFAACFLLIAGLSEPFVSTATKARYEFLSFTFAAIGLLLVSFGRYVAGVFIAALALEIEPMALAALIPVILLAFRSGLPRGKVTLFTLAGILLAAVSYLGLHPDVVNIVTHLHTLKHAGSLFDGGFFTAYFLRRYRHLPEFLLFAIAGALYWRRRHSLNTTYFGVAALTLALFSLVMPHGNVSYMVFAYPFFVVMMLDAFHADYRPWLVTGSLVAFFLLQQTYLFFLTRNLGYRSADISKVSQAIQAAAQDIHQDDDSVRIYGDYRLWFAHPHFYRAAATSTLSHIQDADLYVCFDHPPQPIALEPKSMLYCSDLNALIPLKRIGTVTLKNDQISIYARK